MIEKRQEVLDFLRTDEYPDGSGYGNDYGSGYSSGSGYGNDYGSGSGSGSGYGNDYGSGSGSGYGNDYGSGSGYGDDYGSGYGENIEALNGMVVHIIDSVPTIIDSVHQNFAKGRILNDDLTTKTCYIAKFGNYFAHGDTLEEAVRDARSKYEQNLSVEDRIRLFNEQFPERDRKVPALELFRWHNTLTGSCLAGRKHFCEEHGLDYENGEYTVNEFIALTKDAYGGDIIKQLESSRP